VAEGKQGETLIAFESGHYKKVTGFWKGDSVWCHFTKPDGGMVHINKEKVEYMENFGGENIETSPPTSPPTSKMKFLGEQRLEAEIDLMRAEAERARRKK